MWFGPLCTRGVRRAFDRRGSKGHVRHDAQAREGRPVADPSVGSVPRAFSSRRMRPDRSRTTVPRPRLDPRQTVDDCRVRLEALRTMAGA